MAEKESTIRSIDRALNVLDCFDWEHPSMTLSEIAQKIDLPASTTLRIISTLEARGYLLRNEKTRAYRLGYRLANLGSICLNTDDLRSVAHPHMQALRDVFNESVGLYILTAQNERICIDSVNSTRPLHSTIMIGARRFLTRGAAGKILLAYQDDSVIRQLVMQDGLTSYQDAMDVRAQKYAVSQNEYGEGIGSVAAPIFDATHTIKAAICHSAPMLRITEERLERMVQATVETAQIISKELGY